MLWQRPRPAVAAGAGQTTPKKPPVPQPLKPKPAAPDAAKLARVLDERNVSFDFVRTPLQDAVAFMRQLLDINVILDPDVDGKVPVTVRVNDMAAGKAMQWLAKVGGAEMKLQDGAVYLAAVPKEKPKVAWQAHPYRYRRPAGRAQIQLGDAATVDIQLYEDDLDPDTRKMLLKLLHDALAKELAKLEKAK